MDEALRQNALALLLRDLISLRAIRQLTVTTPVAGAEWSTLVPGGVIWRVDAVFCVLTTSIAVANRRVALVADDTVTEFARINSIVNQTASLATRYTFHRGAVYQQPSLPGNAVLNGFGHLVLQPGERLRTVTENLDVADAYSAIVLRVFELSEWALEFLSIASAENLADVGD